LQQWWLQNHFHHGGITLNGNWANQPSNAHTFLNPSLTYENVQHARKLTANKALSTPIRLIFVGRANRAKGLDVTLKVFRQLVQDKQIEATLDIVGDGESHDEFVGWLNEWQLLDRVQFHKWLPHETILKMMESSHFILLPSQSEGWPKVLSEAMCYGAVPLASDVSAIPQILAETKAGFAIPAKDIDSYTNTIARLVANPAEWREKSQAGVRFAERFTYEYYLIALDNMLKHTYGQSPMKPDVLSALREIFE
jgi:glycosyltransferase involved in cell wall biosynthesis